MFGDIDFIRPDEVSSIAAMIDSKEISFSAAKIVIGEIVISRKKEFCRLVLSAEGEA